MQAFLGRGFEPKVAQVALIETEFSGSTADNKSEELDRFLGISGITGRQNG